MKHSKVRTPAARADGANLPPTEAFVRIQITGICGLVVDSDHSPLVVVMPDGRECRFSSTDPAAEIPSHRAFAMFPIAAASGREADFTLKNGELGVCLLEREMLSLAGGTIESRGGGGDGIVNMANVCAHATAAKTCVAFPPLDGLLAQISLPSKNLSVQTLSEDEYSFAPRCQSVGRPQEGKIAEVVAVDLRVTDASTLMLQSHPFGGASAGPIELSLDGTTAASPLVISIGNVPLPDLRRWVDATPGGHHHDRDVHFELYYTLAPARPPLPLTIPVRRMTKVPRGSNCPVVTIPSER